MFSPDVGVQDALTSNSLSSSKFSSVPKDALATLVTVPLGAVKSHQFAFNDSINQVQPILQSIGSAAISLSIAALTKVTHLKFPDQPS